MQPDPQCMPMVHIASLKLGPEIRFLVVEVQQLWESHKAGKGGSGLEKSLVLEKQELHISDSDTRTSSLMTPFDYDCACCGKYLPV